MYKREIKSIIYNSLYDYLETQELEVQINKNTALFGRDAVLDSNGLVVEQLC